MVEKWLGAFLLLDELRTKKEISSLLCETHITTGNKRGTLAGIVKAEFTPSLFVKHSHLYIPIPSCHLSLQVPDDLLVTVTQLGTSLISYIVLAAPSVSLSGGAQSSSPGCPLSHSTCGDAPCPFLPLPSSLVYSLSEQAPTPAD